MGEVVVVVGGLLLGWSLLPLGFQTFVAPSLSLRLSRSAGLCGSSLRSFGSTETRCASRVCSSPSTTTFTQDPSHYPSHTAIHFHTRRIAPRTFNSSSTCLVPLPFSFGASFGPTSDQSQLPSLTTRTKDPIFCPKTRPCPRRSPQLRESPPNPSLNPRKKTLTKNRTMSKKTTTMMMTKTTPMNMLSRRS